MTDPATTEKIARRYCELMGLDPDMRVYWYMGAQMIERTLEWHIAARDVAKHIAMATAIREVMKDE